MPEGILCVCERLVLGAVIFEKVNSGFLDRFALLLAGFLFEDLAVALL